MACSYYPTGFSPPTSRLRFSTTTQAMRRVSNVAVIGCGISGAVCASVLAGRGVSVTLFESGRGAGGRMSQRRETTEDGKELFFDHGAPFFTVDHNEVVGVVSSWEARGLVAEWKEKIGSFDRTNARFLDIEKEGTSKIYVGVPGMNSICKALCLEPGVKAKFGITVGKLEWLQARSLWSLTGLDGQDLGHFDGVVASDKNVVSPRFTGVTGRPPPLAFSVPGETIVHGEGLLGVGRHNSPPHYGSANLVDLKDKALSPELALMLQDIPVHSCFVLMMAFSEPLSSIPVKGFSIKNSEVLSWAFCDSSKPGHSRAYHNSECWVLHSTAEYAAGVIARTGLQKPSNDTLSLVAEELFQEFQLTGLNIPQPVFLKAHRWGSAFPAIVVGGEDKCLWDKNKRLAICGDFCASPSVEGAVLSGIRAASKILEI